MSKPMSIHKRRERIKHIGEQLHFRQLTVEDNKFLSEALIKIGNGENPAIALEVKARVGESNGEESRAAESRKELVKIVIDEQRKTGKKLTEIISAFGEHGSHLFGLTEETLKTYYQDKD